MRLGSIFPSQADQTDRLFHLKKIRTKIAYAENVRNSENKKPRKKFLKKTAYA
jgi:hypothetical protein